MNITTNLILDEFKKLNLQPLSIIYRDLSQKVENFYCRIFIKDTIFVIARMDKLRTNIKSTLGSNYNLSWNINKKNNSIVEIIILKEG